MVNLQPELHQVNQTYDNGKSVQLVLHTHRNNIACDRVESAWRFFADRCQKVSAQCKTYPYSNSSWSCHSMIVLLNHHRFLKKKINSIVTHYTTVLRGKARRQDNSKFISGSFIRKTIICSCFHIYNTYVNWERTALVSKDNLHYFHTLRTWLE